jgi:hypothetical protein
MSLAAGEAGPSRRQIQLRRPQPRARTFEPPAPTAIMGDRGHERYPVVNVLASELVLQPQQSRSVAVYGRVVFGGGAGVIALSPPKRALLPSRHERANAHEIADREDQPLLYRMLPVALPTASPPAHSFPHSPKSIVFNVRVLSLIFRPDVVETIHYRRTSAITRFIHPYPFHLSARSRRCRYLMTVELQYRPGQCPLYLLFRRVAVTSFSIAIRPTCGETFPQQRTDV